MLQIGKSVFSRPLGVSSGPGGPIFQRRIGLRNVLKMPPKAALVHWLPDTNATAKFPVGPGNPQKRPLRTPKQAPLHTLIETILEREMADQSLKKSSTKTPTVPARVWHREIRESLPKKSRPLHLAKSGHSGTLGVSLCPFCPEVEQVMTDPALPSRAIFRPGPAYRSDTKRWAGTQYFPRAGRFNAWEAPKQALLHTLIETILEREMADQSLKKSSTKTPTVPARVWHREIRESLPKKSRPLHLAKSGHSGTLGVSPCPFCPEVEQVWHAKTTPEAILIAGKKPPSEPRMGPPPAPRPSVRSPAPGGGGRPPADLFRRFCCPAAGAG